MSPPKDDEQRDALTKLRQLAVSAPTGAPSTESTYVVGLVVTNADQAWCIEQDLIVVAKGVRPIVKCSATVLDLTDPAVAKVGGEACTVLCRAGFRARQNLAPGVLPLAVPSAAWSPLFCRLNRSSHSAD